MKHLSLLVCGLAASLALAAAPDPDFPVKRPAYTPQAFETRNTGETSEEEANIEIRKTTPRKIKFTAVSAYRNWRDTEGKVIIARLLAFESGDRSNDDKPLTLIRDGKVRLLVANGTRISELPMTRLSAADQAFVRGLNASQGKTAKPD